MPGARVTDPSLIRAAVDGHRGWYHQIELAPGIVTPGPHHSAGALAALDRVGLPREASRLRVLDLGCRDGFFAFEMERRGAEVVGIDYAAPDVTGFAVAARLLGSSVTYVVENVYDIDPRRHGLFDLVLLLGVLYHLRNPILALDRVRAMVRPGALVFVESQVSTAPRVQTMPLWQFLPRDSHHGDHTNKWMPNLAGLTTVIEECQLKVLKSRVDEKGRACLSTRAVEDVQLERYRALDGSMDSWGRRGEGDVPSRPGPERR